MSAGKGKEALLLVPLLLAPLLLVAGLFLIVPMLNDIQNRNYLDRFQGIELPEGSSPVGRRGYIASNRGDCVHFVGLSMTTSASSASLPELLEPWMQQDPSVFPGGLELVIKERGHDTAVLIPFGLYPLTFDTPVHISMYGSDVDSGINELLAEGEMQIENGRRLVILFTLFQEENIFDVRCY